MHLEKLQSSRYFATFGMTNFLQIQIDWLYMMCADWNKCSEITFFSPHPIYSKHVKQRNAETVWQRPACILVLQEIDKNV